MPRSTPVRLAYAVAGLIALSLCMAISTALLTLSVVPVSGSSRSTDEDLPADSNRSEHRGSVVDGPNDSTKDLACDHPVRNESADDSTVTWRFFGRSGDVLSIGREEAGDSEVELELLVGNEIIAQSLGGRPASEWAGTQSFLLPRDAKYSLTVFADDSGSAYEIALACRANQRTEATALPSPSPNPEPAPNTSVDALHSRIQAYEAVGELVIALLWSSTADLDLHVIDPRGEEIFFENAKSLTGGLLEYEANGSCPTATTAPVETVYWKSGAAPKGEYAVKVHYFASCDDASQQTFTVGVWYDGDLVETVEGAIDPSEFQLVHEFSY